MASKHACCGKGERPLAAGGEPPDLSVAVAKQSLAKRAPACLAKFGLGRIARAP